jgi:two-component system, OmpR family, phosphate regulon sensor histidine kinase PhoR
MRKLNILVRLAVCFLFVFLPLHSLDQWFYDHLFSLRGRHHRTPQLLLVSVNDAKLSMVPGIEKNASLKIDLGRESARRVSHSVWYSHFYSPLLARIEADNPKMIVLASYYGSVDGTPNFGSYKDLLFSAFLNEENKVIPPPTSLTEGENFGYSNIFPDPDNVVRRTYLVYSSGASLMLRAYQRLSITDPITRNLMDPMWIDYQGPTGSYPTFDAQDIYDGEVPSGTFRNKIVIIGREGSPHSDFETPFGKMSRLEIQANAMDTFITHREIRILPHAVTLILSTLSVLAAVAIILYFPLTLAWLLLLLLSVILILVALFCLSYLKLWAGIANPIFCIFGTHLVVLGFKLSRQEEDQWKIQQEAQYLKEMDKFKNNFISLFSHDLKTPIAKIKAVTERLMGEKSLTSNVREGLGVIDKTNNELARFISDILKVTKMESMAIEPSREVLDLNRLVEEALNRLKFLADEKQIKIILDLEPLFSMEGDSQLIQEVITNLVENAIKYSPPNKTVIVRTREEENKVRVSVIDQGEGIPPEELPRVTGKFYRGKSAGQKTKGSGLGLYLSKYFVELHRGQLELRSQLQKGTEVSFWLPFEA